MIFLGGLMGITVAVVAVALYLEHKAKIRAIKRAERDARRAATKPTRRRRDRLHP